MNHSFFSTDFDLRWLEGTLTSRFGYRWECSNCFEHIGTEIILCVTGIQILEHFSGVYPPKLDLLWRDSIPVEYNIESFHVPQRFTTGYGFKFIISDDERLVKKALCDLFAQLGWALTDGGP